MSSPTRTIKPPIRLKGPKLYKLYEEVFERDEYECQNPDCPGGWPIDKAPHHRIPKGRGGSDVADNLQTLCLYCHGQEHGVNYVKS